jgi:hypothetical protein
MIGLMIELMALRTLIQPQVDLERSGGWRR